MKTTQAKLNKRNDGAGERTQIADPILFRYVNGGTTIRKYRTNDLSPRAAIGQRYLCDIAGETRVVRLISLDTYQSHQPSGSSWRAVTVEILGDGPQSQEECADFSPKAMGGTRE